MQINTNEKNYFQPNYNQILIKNNKSFLKQDFLSYINQVQDPFIKELLLLIKRYQQGFECIKINNQTLFNSLFINESDEKGVLFNENIKESLIFIKSLMINKENTFHLKLSIPPSFTKSECEAMFVNDLIDMELKFVIYYEGSYEVSLICEDKSCIEMKIEIGKQEKDLIYRLCHEKQNKKMNDNHNHNDSHNDENVNDGSDYNLLISKLVSVMNHFLNTSNGDYLNGIRQFLNHLQNFLYVYINDIRNQLSNRKTEIKTVSKLK